VDYQLPPSRQPLALSVCEYADIDSQWGSFAGRTGWAAWRQLPIRKLQRSANRTGASYRLFRIGAGIRNPGRIHSADGERLRQQQAFL